MGQECERCKIMVYPHTQVRGIWDRSMIGVRSWSTHILRYGGIWDRSARGVRSWSTHILRYGGYGTGV